MAKEQEVWVTMNDGVRLDASVWVPDGRAPIDGWPTILLIHGHGDAGNKAEMRSQAEYYKERGYLTVSYSVRSQGGSEGLSFHMGAREIFDLQDVIDWVLSEWPVHPQKLGVVGSSQGGWHAYMAAAHHPQVATIVPQNIWTNYDDFVVRNGCLSRWFFTRTMRRRIITAGLQDLARQWALSDEWERLREWVRPTSPMLFVDRICCPVFILHGWHDMGMPPNEVIDLYERLTVPKKLYLGEGGHNGQDTPKAEQLRQNLIDRWLDHWLKGEKTDILHEPAISYTLYPNYEHKSVNKLPVGNVDNYILYLHADGYLLSEAPGQSGTHANVNNVILDPNYTLASAIYDDMVSVPQSLKREVVTFEGKPLVKAFEVLGVPMVRFHLLSNQPAFQIHAQIYDIAQDSTATLISRGHFGTQQAEPGRHMTVEIQCRAIGYALAEKHHIRLVVSNYDIDYVFPFFKPFCARLYHDKARPSALILPLYKTN